MTAPTLPPQLPGRGRTYGFLAGVVATLLTLAVVLPLALGERPDTSAGNGSLTGDGTFAPPTAGPTGPSGAPVTPGPGFSAPPLAGQPGGTTGGLIGGGTTGAQSGTGGQAGSTSGGSSGGTTGRGSEPRRASDQGLTANTVRVGVFLIDLGGASDLGATAPGYDIDDQRQFADTNAKAINARGGIGGRKLEVVYRKVDIIDQQTMRDACTSFGQTDRVFAVFQVLGVYGDPILKCAVDQKLPFISNDGAISSYYSAAKGYVITTQPSAKRALLNMEHELNRLGEYKGKTVGVFYEDGYLLSDSRAVVTALKRRGITPVEGVVSSSDIADALREIPVVAQDFCNKGVDIVLIAVNELYTDQFHSNAERFPNCRPAYGLSDFDFAMNGDAFLDGQNDSFFNRVIAVTMGRVGEGRVGKPEPAADAACRKNYTANGGPAVDRNAVGSVYFNVIAVCGLLKVFKEGMEKAGTNPTRATFVEAIGRLGTFVNPGYGGSSFTPNRYDAPQQVRISRAFLNCRCWRPQTDLYPAVFQ